MLCAVVQESLSDQGRSERRQKAEPPNCGLQIADCGSRKAEAVVSRRRGGFRRSQTAAGRVMGSWYWASWGSWLDGVVEREGVIKFLTVRNLVSRPRSGRLGSSSSSSCSVALRLVLRTQPRSSLVAGGQRESEHIGRSWLNGVVEPEG